MRRHLLGSIALLLWLLASMACHKPPKHIPLCRADSDCAKHQVCDGKKCVCAPSYGRCGGLCVPLQSSQIHCGRCGHLCEGGKICVEGGCVCTDGQTDCGSCTDTNTDTSHCGACGHACEGVERCVQGQCCAENKATLCSDSQGVPQCTDLKTDTQHCGACGSACQAGQLCSNGVCKCPPGQRLCDGRCTAPMDDPDHCGACGTKCGPHEACASGRCVSKCPGDTPDRCGRTCCHTGSHPRHCGKCGNRCAPGMRCYKGRCVCPPHKRQCGARGLCVDTQHNPRHCGKCGNTCPRGTHCAQGRCVPTCPPKHPKSCYGGCYPPEISPEHCGRCGVRCEGGKVCAKGRCQCPSGTAWCDGRCIDTQSDPIHCGKCGNVCPTGTLCAKGQCVNACPQDRSKVCYGACKDPQSNGQNCGECGSPCLPSQQCQAGVCRCPSGQALCDDRCVDLESHPGHCGSCDNPCSELQVCEKGRCVMPCPSTKPDRCNDNCFDTRSDPKHCGACNNKCPEGARCEQGQCLCPTGQSPCDGKCVDTTNDPRHCGKCNHSCNDNESCLNKVCGQCHRCLHCAPKPCPSGQCRSHAAQIGGVLDDISARITTDQDGNSYALGLFQGAVAFGQQMRKAKMGYGIFVLKRDPLGRVVWSQQINTYGGAVFPPAQGAIALDCYGNVYVAHVFRSQATAGSYSVKGGARADTVLIAKLDPKGQFQWLRASNNPVNASVRGIVITDSGGVFVAGNAKGTIGFGGSTAGTTSEAINPYLALFDSSGRLQWIKRPYSAENMQLFGMAATPNGQLAVAGRFAKSLALGAKSWQARAYDAFVGVIANDGSPQWLQTLGGAGKDAAHGVTTDAQGNVYPTGYFEDEIKCGKHKASHKDRGIFVAKFGPKGSASWLVTPIPYATSQGEAITVGPKGQLFVTGVWVSTAPVKTGKAFLQPRGENGAFVLRLEPEYGSATWGDTAGGPRAELGIHGISVDPFGNVHTIGCFLRTAVASGIHVTSKGGIDVHLWKIGGTTIP